MDWTFWALSGLASLGVVCLLLLAWSMFFDEPSWDDHMDEWTDE